MRILSQENLYEFGNVDLPYEMCALSMGYTRDKSKFNIYAHFDGTRWIVAEYSTESKAIKAMEMLRIAYTGRFITNADIPDDFNEQLKELMKGGFGTVIVKDFEDCKVEFNNLNGYFQFPQDSEIEV